MNNYGYNMFGRSETISVSRFESKKTRKKRNASGRKDPNALRFTANSKDRQKWMN